MDVRRLTPARSAVLLGAAWGLAAAEASAPVRALFPEPTVGTWRSPCEPTEDAAGLPFCNRDLGLEDRINDLVDRLDLETAAPQLMTNTVRGPIALIGTTTTLPSYEWWSEALHGIGKSYGVHFHGKFQSATSFPQVVTTSHSFNRTLFREVGDAIGERRWRPTFSGCGAMLVCLGILN